MGEEYVWLVYMDYGAYDRLRMLGVFSSIEKAQADQYVLDEFEYEAPKWVDDGDGGLYLRFFSDCVLVIERQVVD